MNTKTLKGIFITGTDTGVGKTFVAVGIMKALKEKGVNACPMKPVEPGCKVKKGKLFPEDTVKLIRASGIREPIDIINPYRLRHPLAPSVAAEIEKVTIRKQKIFSAYRKLSEKYNLVIIEGAGGIMVPVYKKYLFLDLIKDLNLPLIIVARPGLGTINHTLLTINVTKSKGINILGVIINHSTKIKKGLPEKTNPDVIKRLGGVSLLGTVPYSRSSDSSSLKKGFYKIAGKILKSI